MSYGIVYCVINIKTGMRYVGQTVRMQYSRQRWSEHISAARNGNNTTPLARAIRKYGADSFRFQIVRECQTKTSLDVSEQTFIRTLKTLSPCGYNLQTGGGNGGHSEETKLRIRTTKAQPEVRERSLAALRAVLSSPEYKVRKKAAMSRPETIERLRQSHLGYRPSDETRIKLSTLSKGRVAITDGDQIKHIWLSKGDPIPKGWHRGHPQRVWITDGRKETKISIKIPIPSGWQLGRIYSRKNKKRK